MIRYDVILVCAALLFSCKEAKKEQPNSVKAVAGQDTAKTETIASACGDSNDTLLIEYAKAFSPNTIGLNESFTPQVRQLLDTIDANCFAQLSHSKFFTALVLAKLLKYHLSCCNQGYDLLGMKNGAAALVINRFEQMAGYAGEKMEMLNSGKVEDFISKDSSLLADPSIQQIMLAIRKESARIEKIRP